jgi:hypothetical protein
MQNPILSYIFLRFFKLIHYRVIKPTAPLEGICLSTWQMQVLPRPEAALCTQASSRQACNRSQSRSRPSRVRAENQMTSPGSIPMAARASEK